LGLPIGDVAERDRPLGHRVGQLSPGVDQLIQEQVKRPKQSAEHRPGQWLADQGQVDELK
jgi:hypothetical protein